MREKHVENEHITQKKGKRGRRIALEPLLICLVIVGLAGVVVNARRLPVSVSLPAVSPESRSSAGVPQTQPAPESVAQPEPTAPPEDPAIAALRDKKLVALTFDDGPHHELTPRLLDFLREQGVHATFFVIGCNAEAAPEVPGRAAAEGHQVASHTYGHKNLTKLGPERLFEEIEKAAALIESLTGYRPTALRPPFGEFNSDVQAAAGVPLLLWSVDPKDWASRDADKTFRHVMEKAGDGEIILLHDYYEESIEAAKRIVLALKEQGYTFVTIDELLAVRGGAAPGEEVRRRPPLSP